MIQFSLEASHTINVVVDDELCEQVRKNTTEGPLIISQEFKKAYPYMRKMDASFFDVIHSRLQTGRSLKQFQVCSAKYWKKLHLYKTKAAKKTISSSPESDCLRKSSGSFFEKIEISNREIAEIQSSSYSSTIMQATLSAMSSLVGVLNGLLGTQVTRDDLEKFVSEHKSQDTEADEPEAKPKAAQKSVKAKSKGKADGKSEPLKLTIEEGSKISYYVRPSRPPTKEEDASIKEALGVNLSSDKVYKVAKKQGNPAEHLRDLGFELVELVETEPEPEAKTKAAPKAKAKGAAKAGPVKQVLEENERGILIDLKGTKFIAVKMVIGGKSNLVVVGRYDDKNDKKKSKYMFRDGGCRSLSSEDRTLISSNNLLTLRDDTVLGALDEEEEIRDELAEAGLVIIPQDEDEPNEDDDE